MPQSLDPEKIRRSHDLLFGSPAIQGQAVIQPEHDGYSAAYLRAQMRQSAFYGNDFPSFSPGFRENQVVSAAVVESQ